MLDLGGIEQTVTSDSEVWRIRFSDSTFTYYKSKTLYSTDTNTKDNAVYSAWEKIHSIVGKYRIPTKEFLIGLDETGKGELIGHTVLAGTIFAMPLFKLIRDIVGPADTKIHHDFAYWDELFQKLENLKAKGFDYLIETIPPWDVDTYKLNKIMDITYQRILSIFLRKIEPNKCRIVIDDYGIGETLKRFFKFLEKQGAEVIIIHHADKDFLEVKTASLVSKRERELVIDRINKDQQFMVNGISIGSGNAGDKRTTVWLKKWHERKKPWPWFIKSSFTTIWQLEGKKEGPRKIVPPINETLLSKEFIDEFNKGRLSIEALSLTCSNCGSNLKSVSFSLFSETGSKVSQLKCPICNTFIPGAETTLRYYCGYVLPDSSIIQRNLITRDLEFSKFFADFTVILHKVVRKECDGTSKGISEFEGLEKFYNMGRIKLIGQGRIEEIPSNLSNTERDEMIMDGCLEYNAILLSADKSMTTFAISKKIFTIYI